MIQQFPRPAIRPISAAAMICALFAGCGGELKVAPVTGTVTLDGKPLERASVLFQPAEGGRPSFGVTDSAGNYTLAYSMNANGAEVGACEVKISTRLQGESSDGEYRENAPRAAEKVPVHYAKQPLTVTVLSKANRIDLTLTTAKRSSSR